MSSYVSFFVRKSDQFVGLGDFSRNTVMYSYFNKRALCSKLRELTADIIDEERRDMDTEILNLKANKESIQDTLNRVGQFNNSIEEKMEVFRDFNQEIGDINLRIDEVVSAKFYCDFLLGVLDANGDSSKLYFGEEVSGEISEVME